MSRLRRVRLRGRRRRRRRSSPPRRRPRPPPSRRPRRTRSRRRSSPSGSRRRMPESAPDAPGDAEKAPPGEAECSPCPLSGLPGPPVLRTPACALRRSQRPGHRALADPDPVGTPSGAMGRPVTCLRAGRWLGSSAWAGSACRAAGGHSRRADAAPPR
ncbi:hypothetical protein FGD71_016750 [Streptomyces sporangiiformans]|uniref:Uncharacterized protein n=1 Tax=Streptomyces sporangiiformans TaxID=2315329 RepID=A0A505DEK4_9ACTN|nr:hypothetical protein FGD71_016750 [Streptomyces sporangiiformans]